MGLRSLSEEDVRENEWSLENGAGLFSAYRTRTDAMLWVITKWDRSTTALLLWIDFPVGQRSDGTQEGDAAIQLGSWMAALCVGSVL